MKTNNKAHRQTLTARIERLRAEREKSRAKFDAQINKLSDELTAAKGIVVGARYQMTSQVSARRMRVGRVVKLGSAFNSEELHVLIELENMKTGKVYGTDWMHTTYTNFHRI